MKGIKKAVLSVMIGLALVIGMHSVSHASLYLQLSDGTVGNTFTISDLDGDGVLTFSGAVGGWTVNVSTVMTYPTLGTVDSPQIDLNSVDFFSGSGSNTLTIKASATGYELTPGGSAFTVGGTAMNGSASFAAYSSASNVQFAPSNTLGNLGAFTGAFSGTAGGLVPYESGPYSLTIESTLTGLSAGVTSFDANLAVPEPFTLIFLGSCLFGAGMVSRRFKI